MSGRKPPSVPRDLDAERLTPVVSEFKKSEQAVPPSQGREVDDQNGPYHHSTPSRRLDGDRCGDRRIRVVADQPEVFVPELEDGAYLGIQVHLWQRARLP